MLRNLSIRASLTLMIVFFGVVLLLLALLGGAALADRAPPEMGCAIGAGPPADVPLMLAEAAVAARFEGAPGSGWLTVWVSVAEVAAEALVSPE